MKTSSIITLVITADDAAQRLDKFLAGLEEISSRNYAKNIIEKNLVTVNGKVAKPSFSLATGQIISVELPPVEGSELLPFPLKLDIIFEDKDILVVNKPSGLVVHPAAGHQQDTLVNALLFHTKDLSMKNEVRPGIVHRIDKDTSGLLVVAKNDSAHEALAAQFKAKTTHRVYYALVSGIIEKNSGTINSYLARHPTDRKKFASLKKAGKIISSQNADITNAKWAVTHFKKLNTSVDTTYVEVRLETGRTHQIRVHMSELGHALVGDTMYGYSVKKNKALGLERFYLHAAELGFKHPTTKENLIFKVDWPETDKHILADFGHTLP